MAASLERDGLLALIAQKKMRRCKKKVRLGELAAAHTSLAKLKNEIEQRLEGPVTTNMRTTQTDVSNPVTKQTDSPSPTPIPMHAGNEALGAGSEDVELTSEIISGL